MRDTNNLIVMLRDALRAIEELKTAQLVGTSQIKSKYYETSATYDRTFTVTAPFQSQGSAYKSFLVTVKPVNMPKDNILIADLIADIRTTSGNRVSLWDAANSTYNYTMNYFITPTDPTDPTANKFLVGIVAPTNTMLTMKLGVVTNTDVAITIQDLV